MTSPELAALVDHRREDWQNPLEPVRSSNRFEWSDVDVVVAHYTAADDLIDGDPGEHADELDNYLRSTQHHYLTARGYSIGYNLALDWLGGIWELRGDDYECAANAGANPRAFAVLCLVDGDDRLTNHAAASFRRIVELARRKSPLDVDVTGHGLLPETTSGTLCPGAGIRLDLALGLLDSDTFNPPAPPAPPPEVSLMAALFIARRLETDTYVVGDGEADARTISQPAARRLIAARVAIGAPLFDYGSAVAGRKVAVQKLRDVTATGAVPQTLGLD